MADTAVNEEYTEVIDGDEFVEVQGSGGGDFPPVHDFNSESTLLGTYNRTVTKEIKGKDRIIHEFSDVDGYDDDVVQAWGAALLDSRLDDVPEGSRVKIVKTGDKIRTSSGFGAHEYKVLVARSALARR